LSRKHRGVNLESEARKSLLCSESENTNARTNGISSEEDINMDGSHGVTEPMDFEEAVSEENEIRHITSEGEDELHRSAALLLLTAKERFKLTQSAINFITGQIQHMISFAVDDIEEAVKKYLEDQGIVDEFPELNARFESLRNPFYVP